MPKEPRRLLIVEDALDISTLMQELLEAEGYSVTCASTGRKALAYLESAAEPPGLILLDMMMPDMDGRQFRAEQRQHPRLGSIPILVMTAAGDPNAIAVELGAAGVLKKPFKDIDAILDGIAKFFPSSA